MGLDALNEWIWAYQNESDPDKRQYNFMRIKSFLSESFLQQRIVCLNYATLRNILKQRHNHRLPQWKTFCEEIMRQVQYPQFLKDCME